MRKFAWASILAAQLAQGQPVARSCVSEANNGSEDEGADAPSEN
jgi:hypothetical protein